MNKKSSASINFVFNTLISTIGGIMIYTGVRDLLPELNGYLAIFIGFLVLFIGLYIGGNAK